MKENMTMNHRSVGATTKMQECYNRRARITKLHFQEQTSATLTRGQWVSYSSKGKNSNIHLTPLRNLVVHRYLDDVHLFQYWMHAISVIWHQRSSKFHNSMVQFAVSPDT
jgi:hypothetical protein